VIILVIDISQQHGLDSTECLFYALQNNNNNKNNIFPKNQSILRYDSVAISIRQLDNTGHGYKSKAVAGSCCRRVSHTLPRRSCGSPTIHFVTTHEEAAAAVNTLHRLTACAGRRTKTGRFPRMP